jgi:hypothetical protein
VDEAPPKNARRKRRKRPPPADERRSKQRPVAADSRSDESSGRKRRKLPIVWLIIVALAGFELWLFGRKGDITVCVGREGQHDFSLLGEPRNDENTHRYPTCERRLNVGLRSQYDERVEEATLHACRRATILRGREATLLCALQENGWQHRIDARWVPPYDPEYYRRLFWFAF